MYCQSQTRGAAIASYAGALWFGLPGVALGGLLGTAVTRLLNFNRAARLLGIRFRELQDWSTLGRILLAAAVAGAIAGITTSQLLPELPNIPTLLVGAVIGGGAYAGCMFVFRFSWVPLAMLGRREWPE